MAEIAFTKLIPVFRIFDVDKAKEFYVGYLGFQVDWEHTFEPGMPVYMQVTRGAVTIHLSEHHGDASPGASVFVWMTGVDALHAELSAKGYKSLRPGINDEFYGARSVNVTDPFGNKVHFNESTKGEAPGRS